MKVTAVPAPNARHQAFNLFRSNRKFIVCLLSINLLIAMSISFVAGRKSITVPAEFAQAQAELNITILQQQGAIDRMLRDNRSNTNALSARLAELQAASTRIDALGERLAQMGQLSLDEFDFNQPPPIGGPEADASKALQNSENELLLAASTLGEKLRHQASQMDALQYLMMNRQFESDITPTGWPVKNGWISSGYGERTDPYSGERTHHDGLDFVGKRGSDVLSVANGVVVWAGNRNGYGKTVEIDHGNGYQTLYAHNDSLVVQPGDSIKAGQVIAKLGSSGRAQAPHVHFEVLQNGNTVNPSRYVSNLR
ncbi:MAG: M23 family metallopeptidase [Xanthomonadales bacterium]|nr:M23 family metallopeptidase [Xanthomonadales bacterium]